MTGDGVLAVLFSTSSPRPPPPWTARWPCNRPSISRAARAFRYDQKVIHKVSWGWSSNLRSRATGLSYASEWTRSIGRGRSVTTPRQRSSGLGIDRTEPALVRQTGEHGTVVHVLAWRPADSARVQTLTVTTDTAPSESPAARPETPPEAGTGPPSHHAPQSGATTPSPSEGSWQDRRTHVPQGRSPRPGRPRPAL
jgi:hypothetical protein